VVFGWRALRPPRVVFVIGCVSCNKFSHFRLYIAAAKAARMRDLKAHVVTAEGKHRALALWDHSRDWDPGD